MHPSVLTNAMVKMAQDNKNKREDGGVHGRGLAATAAAESRRTEERGGVSSVLGLVYVVVVTTFIPIHGIISARLCWGTPAGRAPNRRLPDGGTPAGGLHDGVMGLLRVLLLLSCVVTIVLLYSVVISAPDGVCKSLVIMSCVGMSVKLCVV